MKKCRRCTKPATLHITELRDEEVHELHLCESCYSEYIHYSESVAEDEQQSGLAIELASEEQLEELNQLVCPSCEITFREFRSQGRLGCPHDYTAFEAELLPLLENIHGDTQHCGKLPIRSPDSSQQQYRLIRLRKDLQTAVESEEYEAAVQWRDEIHTLELELGIVPFGSEEAEEAEEAEEFEESGGEAEESA